MSEVINIYIGLKKNKTKIDVEWWQGRERKKKKVVKFCIFFPFFQVTVQCFAWKKLATSTLLCSLVTPTPTRPNPDEKLTNNRLENIHNCSRFNKPLQNYNFAKTKK